MKILITGAAGFLGRWFVGRHLMAGDTVVGIDNLSNPYSHWPQALDTKRRVTEDVVKFASSMTGDFDIAYHFAAPVGGREKIEGDPLFNADSLRIDSSFFRWAIDNTKTVVYPSSSAVYGTEMQGFNGHALTEDMFTPWSPYWYAPDEMYGFTKLAGEMLAYKASKYGLNTLCIRPFSGYGEGQSLEYPVPSILNRVRLRQDPVVIWGSGEQTRDFIHVEDVVEATQRRLAAGILGYDTMNIGSGVPDTFIEVAKIAAQIEGYDPAISVDTSKPEGVFRRYADTAYMRTYYTPKVSLYDGIKRVLMHMKAER